MGMHVMWRQSLFPKNNNNANRDNNSIQVLKTIRIFNLWHNKGGITRIWWEKKNVISMNQKLWQARKFLLPLFSCVSVLLDLNLRGPRCLRPRPQVCELCQAWDCWSLSHEPGWDGERRRWPHRSWSQPVHFSLWGRTGRWNELRDFLLTSVKKKKKRSVREPEFWSADCLYHQRNERIRHPRNASVVFFSRFPKVLSWCWMFTFRLECRRLHIGKLLTSWGKTGICIMPKHIKTDLFKQHLWRLIKRGALWRVAVQFMFYSDVCLHVFYFFTAREMSWLCTC